MHKIYYVFIILLFSAKTTLANEYASKPWNYPKVDEEIARNILYIPIADPRVKAIEIVESGEELVDLLQVKNPRIKSLAAINKDLCNTYEGYSKVRKGIYKRMLKMLQYLPKDIGIAFCEGFRPIAKQKEYFDQQFKEKLLKLQDKEKAYIEASKFASPFIANTPTHCTGAAIDMTLFRISESKDELLTMSKFDIIAEDNLQEEIFSEDTTRTERTNRLLLLTAASKAGLTGYGYKWWHFSYGDKMWAYVNGKKNAIYGLATPSDDPILSMDKESYLKKINE